ncbi:hypothetical protein Tco_1409076 [Tanacetum coccineum]
MEEYSSLGDKLVSWMSTKKARPVCNCPPQRLNSDMFTKALQERFQYLSDELRYEMFTLARTGEHPSDTYVLTMKMEILLEPASNKLLVDRYLSDSLFPVLSVFETFRIHKDGDGDASFQLESNSLPHAHAQTTKTYYRIKIQGIMISYRFKDKDFRTNSDIQDLPSKISSLSREIVSKLSR